MSEEQKNTPPEPRHAASLILLRETAHGADVLMGMRGAKAAFMPSRLVFPGGRVDEGDENIPVAQDIPTLTATHLAKAADATLTRALPRTAIRELEEETGLILGNPADLSSMDYLCRAVTPPDLPIRFNARFLIVPADMASGTLGGSGELEDLRWFSVDEAMTWDLARITRNIMEELLIWRAMSVDERAAPRKTPFYNTHGNTRARGWE